MAVRRVKVPNSSRAKSETVAPKSERSSFAKALGILDLFGEGRIRMHSEDVARSLGTARATTYRYLRALCDAGLLSPTSGGVYVLGPRIIEFDRLMRISDPLLTAGRDVMREVSAKRGMNMLLARYFRDSIMCVDSVWPDQSIPADFERGLPMSIFRGAMAKIILAHLSPYQLRNVALHHADEIRAAGLGDTWPEFRVQMLELTRQGFAITRAEMRPHGGGISAPIFDQDDKILGSITFVVRHDRWETTNFEKLRVWITEAAERITKMIAEAAASDEARENDHRTAATEKPSRTRTKGQETLRLVTADTGVPPRRARKGSRKGVKK